ncbi:maleylpyruvate isomerase family mycothiol-dependent enzyme [Streptomyces sp. NPDC059063]|uniref:maleylpyruvate isomerase family mycothiol-dependent enzyme n=1 Tax=unclassified Streptomyces TaxID=2593676 RepID=UPI0036A8C35E
MSGAPRPAPDEHPELCSLLGAWLLNACSAQERIAMAAHVKHCALCAAEMRDLHPAVTSLTSQPQYEDPAPYADLMAYEDAAAYEDHVSYEIPAGYENLASPDDGSHRSQPLSLPLSSASSTHGDITALAFARRPPAPRHLPPHIRPYADQVATLDAVLRDLAAEEWNTQTVEGWTVAQLVAHLAATDSLLAETLDATARGPLDLPGDTVPARTRAFTSWAVDQPPASVHAAWRTQADLLRDTLVREAAPNTPAAEGPYTPGDRLGLADGPRLTLADHATTRAFETWIHTRDLALHTGRRLPPPTARSLTRMSDLGARQLPFAMRHRGTPLGHRVLHVELTGPGGDTWHLTDPENPSSERPPDTHLVVGAMEFCLLTAARRTPAETAAHTRVTGDTALADAALAAAPAFAGP